MYIILMVINIILLALIIFDYIGKRTLRNLKFILSLPGVPILLSFVHGLQISCGYTELVTYLMKFNKRFEGPSRFVVGIDMYVVLTKPEDYKSVLSNVDGNYKTSVTKFWKPLLGDGIIRVSGALHKLRRKIIEPQFNSKFLSKYVTYFDRCSRRCADLLENELTNGNPVVKSHITRCIMDVILVTFAGVEGTAQRRDYDDLLSWQRRVFGFVYDRSIKPWLHDERIFSLTKDAEQTRIGLGILRSFIHDISWKAAERKTSNGEIDVEQRPESVFFERLFEDVVDNDNVTDQDFIDDITCLYVAAQNTLMELTYFVLLMLAMHPEIQDNLRQEISTLEKNEPITASSILRMRYLQMVIKETLRLFPVAFLMARELTADIEIESCTLPSGCQVMIPIYTIHRNPKYWSNPNEFIPERFASGNSHNHDAYLPFGTGLRSCPGQMYTLLCVGITIVNLIERFRFATPAGMKDLDITNDILIRSPDNIELSLSRV